MSNDNLSAGSIMLDRLGDSIAIIKGKKPSVINLEPISDTALPYILIESFGGKYRQFTDDATCKRAYEDDVLLVWDGERAGLSSYGHSGYIGSTLAAIRVKDTKLKPNYLFRIFEKEREWLRGNSEGTGVPHLSRWAVENIIYFKPPLPEQQKIATILSSVDDVIEKTRAQIDKLKDLKTGMMQELLTKGIGHTEFKDSPVGRIPKDWQIVLMDSLCNKITDGEHQTPKRSSKGYYLLSARNIRDGYIALHDVDFVPEAEYQRISKRVSPKEDDILISCSGSIGRTAVVPKNLKFSMVRSVAILQPKHKIVNAQFLAHQVSSPLIQTQIEKALSQMAQANLFQAPIKALKVVLPPKCEQLKIAHVINSIVQNINDKTNKLESAKNLKKALMQDLLTGKVRVKLTALDSETVS